MAGRLFVISAGLAWYTVAAMLLAHAFGRTVLPTFKYSRAANIPGRKPTRPIELEWAEPGVTLGQYPKSGRGCRRRPAPPSGGSRVRPVCA